jgi:hypothetical protein
MMRKSFRFHWAMAMLLFGLVFLSSACAVSVSAPPPSVPRELDFGGQLWRIKTSQNLVAPGPNYWSDAPDMVWVDADGMHLNLKQKDGKWYSTEIFTKRALGYGTYTFVIDSDIKAYDPFIVAGFFTWDNRPDEANREIDIEFASWGMPGGTKGHYVVQPNTGPEKLSIFEPRMQGTYSTHRIVWTLDTLEFTSYHGYVDPDDPGASANLMHTWTFAGTPPTKGNARFRINLWSFQGKAPRTSGASLVIKEFNFSPWVQ